MKYIILLLVLLLGFGTIACTEGTPQPTVSSSGVQRTTVQVQTDTNGRTVEQNNIAERYKIDNTPGSVKHLYIISAYSGQVILYSTVRGKVTSSGKRLTPTSVEDHQGQYQSDTYGFPLNIGGTNVRTTEVLQDDGTYGSSAEYIYWFDSKGVYHQQYITGGMILHVSSEPVAVKNVLINVELEK